MCLRRVGFGLLAGLWLCAVGGCRKSSQDAVSPSPEIPPAGFKVAVPETVARLHWLGKKRLEGETNAAFFMSIWDMPESTKLEAQTLDKLALALASSLTGSTNPASVTNSSVVSMVRPLLEDLLNEESYLEVRSATNQPGELALAIRLNQDRAGVWETNLARILVRVSSSTPGSSIGGYGWQLDFESQESRIKNHLVLARVGTWTLLTLSRWPLSGGPPQSTKLLDDLAARVQNSQPPFGSASTNFWLETDLDLGRIARALGFNWKFPAGIPKVSLTMIGDGLNVRTRGELAFPKPLGLEFEPWNVPTNLVHNPLVSFSAINGIRPWLTSLPAWTNLNLGRPPDQVYLWGIGGAAIETYFAAPIHEASNAVYALSGRILDSWNPWLASNNMGEFRRTVDVNGLAWKGFPFVEPFLKEISLTGGGFAFGGLGPAPLLTNAVPEALIAEITAHTNLFYYDWEITGPRIQAGIYNSQALRLIAHKAQLPSNGASMVWLKALSLKLGNSGTELTATDLTHLSFIRKSSFGLTATELLLLADWLESPSFPRGIHTFEVPVPPLPSIGREH